ncbi:LacI family DNA-binding transcriptional regulator [Ktedonospora formicarum]|uniref:LacI family transcriptional regulator n=1 Tax=Ktedonospora formicarum TaxID=2778364 RepID=A0A8J3MS44_9CHLR|nr:LacI family DNA-binding transcriptional regulator [Ktedonospora formicarum]GHO46722.1 LacI family transcriptional regulator [Ktedonospora formicarum]
MGKQTASIVDVAKRAGVSVASASRVLSGSSYPVSDETRQKVLEAAQALDYAPNTLARSLRAQRSNLIAVIVGDNADPYFAEITRGVEEVANERGYLTIVCNTDRQSDRELHYLRMLQDYRADGVIFAGSGLNEPEYLEQFEKIIETMQARGAAIVALAQHTLQLPTIQVDNFGGARAMTRHLIEQGHRRIAFVSGPTNLLVATARLQGYTAALVEAGLCVDSDLILPGNFNREGGEQAAHKLAQFAAEQRPSAVFAANDETAFGVLSGLSSQGWRIPADISICGFGDLPMASVVYPPLTTVHIGLRELGRSGAHKLLAQLQREEIEANEIIPTSLSIRCTTS